MQPSLLSISRTSSSPQKEAPYPLGSHCSPLPPPSPSLWRPLVCFLSVVLPVLDIHVTGILQRVTPRVWLLSPGMLFSRFIPVCSSLLNIELQLQIKCCIEENLNMLQAHWLSTVTFCFYDLSHSSFLHWLLIFNGNRFKTRNYSSLSFSYL